MVQPTTQQRVFIVTNYMLTKSVTKEQNRFRVSLSTGERQVEMTRTWQLWDIARGNLTKQKPFICKIVLLASVIAINYYDEKITYTVNSIPIGKITLNNDLYRGEFYWDTVYICEARCRTGMLELRFQALFCLPKERTPRQVSVTSQENVGIALGDTTNQSSTNPPTTRRG